MLVLKELYALSDPQAADALKYDIRWKVACGRSLTDTSFDPSTLVYWRQRIAASERPDRVFDKVAEVITETGILKGRRKWCVDSTVVDGAVATRDTVTQLVAAIRRVARLVPGAAGVIAEVCALDYTRAGKPDIDWDDPQAKADLVSTLVNDALAVLARLCGPGGPQRDPAAADALGLLALVAGQDVEPADESDGTDGRWRIARKVAPDRVISTVDPQTRHARKSKSVRRDGYRAHLATEPETGLITDAELTMATGETNTDAAMGVTMANRDRFHPTTTEPGDTSSETGDTSSETAETPCTVARRRSSWALTTGRWAGRQCHASSERSSNSRCMACGSEAPYRRGWAMATSTRSDSSGRCRTTRTRWSLSRSSRGPRSWAAISHRRAEMCPSACTAESALLATSVSWRRPWPMSWMAVRSKPVWTDFASRSWTLRCTVVLLASAVDQGRSQRSPTMELAP